MVPKPLIDSQSIHRLTLLIAQAIANRMPIKRRNWENKKLLTSKRELKKNIGLLGCFEIHWDFQICMLMNHIVRFYPLIAFANNFKRKFVKSLPRFRKF